MTALVLMAVITGSFLGEVARGFEPIAWFGKIYEVGFDTFTTHLQFMDITLGAQIHVCIAQMVLLLIALLCYPKLKALIIS